ncbi:DMT family transporter [Chakrabartyella piscis]|uniref:DMT family transporter n=1 Tax=Chakrabartyella piscis TaxID=2918914 RepID=UPI002958CF0C|nr:DMT family transporter [Chakrabartyella piscis]
MNQKTKGITLVLIAACLWGVMGVFVRGLNGLGYSSVDIACIRCLAAGAVFFAYQKIKHPQILKIDRKGLIISLAYGAVAYGISFISYGASVERIPIAVATVLMFMSPLWVALLGRIFFGDVLSKAKMIGIVVCMMGAVMVSNLLAVGGVKLDGFGVFAGAINGLGVALQLLIPRYYAERYNRDTMLVYGFFGGALILLVGTDFSVIANSFATAVVGETILHIFGIGILCTMIANVFYVKSSMYIDATTTSILAALEIVVSVVVGVLVFQETLSLIQGMGAVIVVLGALVPSIQEMRK